MVAPRGQSLAGQPHQPPEIRRTANGVDFNSFLQANPQLAAHGGRATVQEVSAQGVVLLRFGGGCHGCGMADVTLKQGIEKTLMARVPGVTAVRDATDHDSGQAPYMPRGSAA